MIFKYPKEAVYYKMIQQLLRFLHTSAGRQWMNTEITDNKFYLHSMLCVLQNVTTSMYRTLCRDSTLIARLNNKEEIRSPTSITTAKQIAKTYINDIKNESNSLAAGYKNKPKTYDHFKYGTQAVQESRPHPVKSTIDTTAVKRLKTSPTDSGDTNNRSTQSGTGHKQKVSFADSPAVEFF